MAFSDKRERKRESEREREEDAVEGTNRHVGEHRAIKRGIPKRT